MLMGLQVWTSWFQAHYMLGLALLQRKEYGEAVKQLEKVVAHLHIFQLLDLRTLTTGLCTLEN